jgi:glycosyltransferase involved in cell wall biosynthesis
MKKTLKPKISVILNTLNDEKRDLDYCFESIIKNAPHQFIVVDGGSEDNTVKIAKKYTENVYVSPAGIQKQQNLALSYATGKFLIIAETDHIYPDDFFNNLLEDYLKANCFGVQGKLKCIKKDSFWERGTNTFFELEWDGIEYVKVPTGPSIYLTKQYKDFSKVLSSQLESNYFCTDTVRADFMNLQNLKVKYSQHIAYQNEKLGWNNFKKKYLNYGAGDYYYYRANKKTFSFVRRLKSLTHVFRKYGVILPFKSMWRKDFYISVPFFMVICIVRYFGFFLTVIKHKTKL